MKYIFQLPLYHKTNCFESTLSNVNKISNLVYLLKRAATIPSNSILHYVMKFAHYTHIYHAVPIYASCAPLNVLLNSAVNLKAVKSPWKIRPRTAHRAEYNSRAAAWKVHSYSARANSAKEELRRRRSKTQEKEREETPQYRKILRACAPYIIYMKSRASKNARGIFFSARTCAGKIKLAGVRRVHWPHYALA